jgi:hypothetical protein
MRLAGELYFPVFYHIRPITAVSSRFSLSRQYASADNEETGYKYIDWNQLAKGRFQWQALVNMKMNIQVMLKPRFALVR